MFELMDKHIMVGGGSNNGVSVYSDRVYNFQVAIVDISNINSALSIKATYERPNGPETSTFKLIFI